MKAILQCLILGGLLSLAACGGDKGSSPAPATAVVTANGCAADQIPTQAGCGVYSPTCGPNAGLVGSTCSPAVQPTNCAAYQPGVQPQYGCPGYNNYNGYNGYNGYNSGYAYQQGYQTGGMIYDRTTQQFISQGYYQQTYVQPVQPVVVPYGYGYRPYYPPTNGVQVSGGISFSF